MSLDKLILIKIIIVLYFCQSWRPIQCDDTINDYYTFYESDETTLKDDLSTRPPGSPGVITQQQSPLPRRRQIPVVRQGRQSTAELDARLEKLLQNQTDFGGDESYDEKTQYWQNSWQKALLFVEWSLNVKHIGEHDDVLRACYYIGTSYQNAITDIRHYFPMRYLYVNNLHYEVGFLTHEIVFKYQMLLEMFHIVQGRFTKHRTRFYAPTQYMLYMYSHILDMSKQIVHLCNMMHELEKKYRKHPNTLFQDYHLVPKDLVAKAIQKENDAAIKQMQKQRKDEYKIRMKAMKKKRQAMVASGVFTTEMRTRRRTRLNKHNFNFHYGWSIEDW